MSTGRRPSLLLSRQGSIPQDAPRFNTARRSKVQYRKTHSAWCAFFDVEQGQTED